MKLICLDVSYKIILPGMTSTNSDNPYKVYEGESLKVCIKARAISTEVTTTVKGVSVETSASAVGKL